MADEKTTAKTDEAPRHAEKPARAKAETAKRDSVVADKVNMVDGKAEKIANPRTSAEAYDGGSYEKPAGTAPEKSEFAPTPWQETEARLDNRQGDQQVAPEAWAPKPQHVNGGEVGDKRKLDNRD